MQDMDFSSLSVSNTVSKGDVHEEMTFLRASMEDASDRLRKAGPDDRISNESIRQGDDILETYDVVSDAIPGGMGSVWKVHHQKWDTDLAMKRPQPKYFAEGSRQQKELFVSECENWIRLGLHPNIVSCYYVREIGGVPTIFSEWMDGGSLKDCMKSGALHEGTEQDAQERILDIAIQAARGLEYSHSKGLIHRDVKPGNILLTKEWDAKMADFGLAKAQSSLTDGKAPFFTGYTLSYCPAEQATSTEAARWMDVYAWALTVIEMYAERRLWKNGAEAKENMDRIASETKAPESTMKLLRECILNTPDSFSGVIESLEESYRILTGKKYPRPDPESAADTADSLNNLALSFLDLNKPVPAREYWSKALKKEPENLTVIYNLGLFQWRTGEIQFDELKTRLDTSGRGMKGDAKRYRGMLNAEQEDITPVKIEGAGRTAGKGLSFEWKSKHVAVSPDDGKIFVLFKELACYDGETHKKIYETKGLLPRGEYAEYLFVTPDGKYLLFNSSPASSVTVADAATGEVLRSLEGHEKTMIGGVTGREGYGDVLSVCPHPDGIHCYTGGKDKTLRKWDLMTGECKRVFRTNPDSEDGLYPRVLCMSPDGQTICFASSKTVCLMDESSGRLKQICDTGAAILDMCFSPDGKILYTCGPDGVSARETDLLNRGELKAEGDIKRIFINSDGRYLISGGDKDRTVKVWNTESWKCIQAFQNHKAAIGSIAATKDMSLIVTGSCDKTALAWKGLSAVRRASWAVSRAASYNEQTAQQNLISEAAEQIDKAMAAGETASALELLGKAESSFGPHAFLPFRNRLMRICKPGKVFDFYKSDSFQYTEREGQSTAHLQADPGGNGFAAYYWNSNYFEDRVCIFAEDGTLKRELHSGRKIRSMSYSPFGKMLAVMTEQTFLVWNAETGELLMKDNYESPGIMTIPRMWFSPDETRIAYLSGKQLECRDIRTGENLYSIPDTHSSDDAYFDAAGRFLNIEGKDGILRKYDAASGTLISEGPATDTPRDERRRRDLSFSHDGLLAAAREKDSICIWSCPEKEVCCRIPNFSSYHFAISADGGMLYASEGDTIHIFVLRRELSCPDRTDWDDEADPLLNGFLSVFPHPMEEQVQLFLRELQISGFGYIRETDVREKTAHAVSEKNGSPGTPEQTSEPERKPLETKEAPKTGFFSRLFSRRKE